MKSTRDSRKPPRTGTARAIASHSDSVGRRPPAAHRIGLVK